MPPRFVPMDSGHGGLRSVQLPQNEQFLVADSMWINTGEVGHEKFWDPFLLKRFRILSNWLYVGL